MIVFVVLGLSGCGSNEEVVNKNDDIFVVVSNGDLDNVKRLLDTGVSIELEHPLGGSTPLIFACVFGHTDIVEYLIGKGADLNTCNRSGDTPIHIATFFCHTEIIELLLTHDVTLNVKNDRGSSPLDPVASPWSPELEKFYHDIKNFYQIQLDMERIKSSRQEVSDILQQAGAKISSQF